MSDPAYEIMLANDDAVKRGVLSMWTIYNRPKDYPDGFIARRFEVGRGEPPAWPVQVTDHTLTGELEAIRATFLAIGMTCLNREPGDEPPVVETWL
jgi:hypothetical protein